MRGCAPRARGKGDPCTQYREEHAPRFTFNKVIHPSNKEQLTWLTNIF